MKSIIQFNILHEELGSEAAREGYDLAVGPLVAERRCPHALVVRGKGGLGPFEQLPDLDAKTARLAQVISVEIPETRDSYGELKRDVANSAAEITALHERLEVAEDGVARVELQDTLALRDVAPGLAEQEGLEIELGADVPYRAATSPTGEPPRTSRTARYRYSASAC